MSTHINLRFDFPDDEQALSFSEWFDNEHGHGTVDINSTSVEINVFSYGDRMVAKGEAENRGGKVTDEYIEDDD